MATELKHVIWSIC